MTSLPPVYEDDIPCARADYPPQVHSIEFLGQVHDADKFRNYARTHGCSTLLNYEPIFLFNDTFEISPAPRFARMEYTPVASITAAFGSPSNPTVTTYPTYTDRRHIPQFIPFSRAEKAAGVTRGYYLTVFNSVVQVPGKEFGVVWFMKMRGGGGGSADVFCGVGVAEVKIDAEGAPGCDRKEELVFDGFGPRWGDISTVLHGDYIYLYGSGAPIAFANDGTCNGPVYQATHPTTTDESKPDVPIYLCRVPYRNRAYWQAENYKYWNGEGFVDFPRASQSLVPPFYYQKGRFVPSPDFKCVMKNVQSGTVMHARLFNQRGHFIFIGCELDSSGDGDDDKKKKEAMVKIRLADEPMGPWFGEASLFDLNTANSGNKGVRFGVHAHPWASDLENGEIVVSWTEPWPGTVEMAKVKLVMQPSPLPRVMESTATATAATTTVAYHSRHCRNNARAAISDFFDEAPIPEDPEPESEPELEPEPESEPDLELEPESEPDLELEPESEPELESGFEPEPEEEVEVNPEQKLCNREKARNKALAKLAGQYNREEDSDPDTESVCDFKKAFENMLDPPGCSSPSPSFEEELTGSILRPYSGYYLRTIVPNDISGSWILEETDCHYPDDAFDNNRDSLDDSCDNNQGEKIPPLLSKKDLEEQAAAAKNANHNSSSTNSSPETSNYSSSFWRHDSDTNTEYSTSASPVFSSPIAIAASNPPHHYPPPPPDPDQCGRAYPYPPPHGSLLPPPIPGTELSMVGSPLSVFDTHSSSQTVATTVRRGKKKYAVKKLLWGKKDQAQAQPEQAQEQVQAEGGVGDGGGNEKKGWKNSLKKSAIAKFLKGGGGSA